MEQKGLLTIVIPVYNRAEIVGRTLDSIAAQTYRPLTLVLVDNGSRDNTLGVLNRWKSDHQASDFSIDVLSEQRPGACAARNTGLAKVTTEWTMFFDSDDTMHHDHCARAMAAVAANPDADVIGWDALLHRLNGSTKLMRFINHDVLYNNLMHSSFSTQRYFAKTSVFHKAGGWNESAKIYDDCELGTRIILSGAKIVRIDGKPTVDVYESEVSITASGRSNLDAITPALDAMRSNLPTGCRHWVDLQQLIKISTWGTPTAETQACVDSIMARQPWHRRQLWRLLFAYSLRGGRGVARIYRIFTRLGF